ncbi:MAG: hypothetical protein ACTSPD_20620, partial [Promethearchaeota archaeon]
TLVIDDKEYEFEEVEDGVYQLTFSTEDINAFFTSQTLTGEIIVEKDDYITETISITIVVEMEEIFPGIPTFYFFMLVGAVAAVVGSLVAYRAIQQAKIPKFVKKVRSMKGAIQGRKSISESLLYPPKNEVIVKKLGDKWEMLGLSLADILGIESKKGKKLSEAKKPKKLPEGGVE